MFREEVPEVNPARAGIILQLVGSRLDGARKPRASGDNFESYILFSTREGQTPRRGLLSKQQMV